MRPEYLVVRYVLAVVTASISRRWIATATTVPWLKAPSMYASCRPRFTAAVGLGAWVHPLSFGFLLSPRCQSAPLQGKLEFAVRFSCLHEKRHRNATITDLLLPACVVLVGLHNKSDGLYGLGVFQVYRTVLPSSDRAAFLSCCRFCDSMQMRGTALPEESATPNSSQHASRRAVAVILFAVVRCSWAQHYQAHTVLYSWTAVGHYWVGAILISKFAEEMILCFMMLSWL